MMQDIPKGKTESINFRKLEYYLKCPLRFQFNKDAGADPSVLFSIAMDQTIAYSTLKLSIGDTMSTDELMNAFMKRFKTKIKDINQTNVPLDIIVDAFSTKASTLIINYHKAIDTILKRYTIQLPSFTEELCNYGTFINIQVHLIVKKISKRHKHKPKYIVIDYSNGTKYWNMYGKLWASAIKLIMLERGISAIDVSVMNLYNMKIADIVSNSNSISDIMLNNITKMYSANYVYPVFGKHCFSCFYQEACSRSCNY